MATQFATYEDAVKGSYRPQLSVFGDMTSEEIMALYEVMTEEEKAEFDLIVRNSPPSERMAHQVVPWDQDWWELMMLIGGRGVGKTGGGVFAVRDHLRMEGKKARVGIGAPTNADARDVCMEGDSGLITTFPNEFKYYNRSLGEAVHINGGYVKAMGTEKEKKWNGPQWSFIWFDELSLCNQKSWNDANLGLRLGSRPRALGTMTPKNKKWVKKLAQEKTTYVPQYIDVATGKRRLPTTRDNPFLPKARVDWLYNKYGGTRMGRQELEGLFVDDIEGAMWRREWFKTVADPSEWPRFVKRVIAIDPAGSVSRKTADKNALTEEQKQNHQKNADTAIAAVALGDDGLWYILEVKSGQWTPSEWGQEAIRMFHYWKADRIVAERNYGGDMVEDNIRKIDIYDKKSMRQLVGRYLPIKVITASQGKHIRAQPVSTLYEQGRVIHCQQTAQMAACEDQMCAFIDADDNEGADMVDAVVWAVLDIGGFTMDAGNIIILQGDPRLQQMQSNIIVCS